MRFKLILLLSILLPTLCLAAADHCIPHAMIAKHIDGQGLSASHVVVASPEWCGDDVASASQVLLTDPNDGFRTSYLSIVDAAKSVPLTINLPFTQSDLGGVAYRANQSAPSINLRHFVAAPLARMRDVSQSLAAFVEATTALSAIKFRSAVILRDTAHSFFIDRATDENYIWAHLTRIGYDVVIQKVLSAEEFKPVWVSEAISKLASLGDTDKWRVLRHDSGDTFAASEQWCACPAGNISLVDEATIDARAKTYWFSNKIKQPASYDSESLREDLIYALIEPSPARRKHIAKRYRLFGPPIMYISRSVRI